MNERFFESAFSKPIITIQPDEKCHALGWFVPHNIWKDGNGYSGCEINLSANFLDRSKEEISSTLLHEMCHQFAYINDIRDCCRNVYYHNKEFAQIAMTHGLVCRSCGQSVRATREVDIICGKCHKAMVEDVKMTREH